MNVVLNRYRIMQLLALGWSLAIFIGCSLPGNGIPDLTNKDKWIHAGVFVGFGLLWRLSGRSAGWVITAGIAYGYLIEVYQGVMPFIHRSYDLYDALADAVGTVLGVGLAWLVLKLMKP